MSKNRASHNTFKLAGCISLEAEPSSFGFQWHDSLMPVGPNYTALERAVFECACAGCESVWITVNDDWAPLIRDRIGEYVFDPVFYYRQYDVNPRDSRKIIPIFFVPHLTKYRHKRESLGWGVVNSAIYAHKVTKTISEFLSPNMFYAAFPFGTYNPRELIKERLNISSNRRFFTSYKGKTIKDNMRLGFSFSYEDTKLVNEFINREGTGVYKHIGEFVKGDRDAWSQRLPAEEQYSAKSFNLQKVFEPIAIEGATISELEWFYDINTWDGYKKFMASENFLKRPKPIEKDGILHPVGIEK